MRKSSHLSDYVTQGSKSLVTLLSQLKYGATLMNKRHKKKSKNLTQKKIIYDLDLHAETIVCYIMYFYFSCKLTVKQKQTYLTGVL